MTPAHVIDADKLKAEFGWRSVRDRHRQDGRPAFREPAMVTSDPSVCGYRMERLGMRKCNLKSLPHAAQTSADFTETTRVVMRLFLLLEATCGAVGADNG